MSLGSFSGLILICACSENESGHCLIVQRNSSRWVKSSDDDNWRWSRVKVPMPFMFTICSLALHPPVRMWLVLQNLQEFDILRFMKSYHRVEMRVERHLLPWRQLASWLIGWWQLSDSAVQKRSRSNSLTNKVVVLWSWLQLLSLTCEGLSLPPGGVTQCWFSELCLLWTHKHTFLRK